MMAVLTIVFPLLGFAIIAIGAKALFQKLRAAGYDAALDKWDARFRAFQRGVLQSQVNLSKLKSQAGSNPKEDERKHTN